MRSDKLSSQIHCQQCTAGLPVEQGSQFVTCEFCNTTNFVDKTRAVFHYAVRSSIQENDAIAALRRWMGGNATVKDLDQNAEIAPVSFEYFPRLQLNVREDFSACGSEMTFLKCGS